MSQNITKQEIGATNRSLKENTPEIGQTIPHYRILEKIGRGGMREMYRTESRRLGRDTAIRVLPEECAKAAECIARYQRDATFAGFSVSSLLQTGFRD
jgi:hypothetical protein